MICDVIKEKQRQRSGNMVGLLSQISMQNGVAAAIRLCDLMRILLPGKTDRLGVYFTGAVTA